MAELSRIVRRNPLSNFRQVAPAGGTAFRALADVANVAYEFLEPAAIAQMEQSGAAAGREMARQHLGENRAMSLTASSRSGLHSTTALGGGLIDQAKRGIAGVESGGQADPYRAVGPAVNRPGGRTDHAYGKYQVMGDNVGPWTEKHYGQRLTPEEFLKNEEAQERVFEGEFGSYIERFGNLDDAASMWFSGRPASGNRRSDGHIDVPEYIRRFHQHADGPAFVASSKAPQPEAVVRTSEGNLEPRLYSPLSGPILQAHNAAAQVAYQSAVLERGAIDMMELSTQFALQPEKFREVAEAYVDDLAENAPEMFREDLRNSLGREMVRRYAGMVEEKHRDIRARANNSSRALMDRWQGNYAAALASGSEEEAATALEELQSILTARESLPGVAWTPEQSENVIIAAEDMADKIREDRLGEIRTGYRDTLNTIIRAARAGRAAEDEAILQNPLAAELLPELYREAAGAVAIRDLLPSFWQTPPDERQAVLEEERSRPIGERWETHILDALEKADREITQAFKDDPMKAAAEHFQRPPPELPPFDPVNPDPWMNALRERLDYAERMAMDGWTDMPVPLTEDEAEAIGAIVGPDSIPEARAALAIAIAHGAGRSGIHLFDQLGVDTVTREAGKLVAAGGDRSVATAAIRGQELVKQGVVTTPSNARNVEAFSETIAGALRDFPNWERAQGQVMTLAKALYAEQAHAQGITDATTTESRELMEQSIQRALGQRQTSRGVTGGVQPVLGGNVLLPPGVSQQEADVALHRSLGVIPQRDVTHLTRIMENLTLGSTSAAMEHLERYNRPRPEAWAEASGGSQPFWNGVPLAEALAGNFGGERPEFAPTDTPEGTMAQMDAMMRHTDMQRGTIDPTENLRLRVMGSRNGRPVYALEVHMGGGSVSDVVDEGGLPFMFDLQALIEAAR